MAMMALVMYLMPLSWYGSVTGAICQSAYQGKRGADEGLLNADQPMPLKS